nr:long-chain-fatty-acid--CoA ligase [Alicyclobacillus sp.]
MLHTLNLRLAPDDIAYIVNHAADRFLIVDDVLLPLFERFRHQTKIERVFVVPLTRADRSAEQAHSADGVGDYEDYEAFLRTAEGRFRPPEIREEDPAGMCYTSGTTGRPKGVVYSHRALVIHTLVQAMPDALNISHRDTTTPVVPMFHANGWGIPYVSTLVGAKQVFPGPHLDPESLLDLFVEERVTFTAGVPTIWLGIAQALARSPERWPLHNIRMGVGGAAVPPDLIRTLEQFGCQVMHAWGMTETSPLGSVSVPKRYMTDLSDGELHRLKATQGVAAPFVEMRLMREEGLAPWDGVTMGEVQVRGPWIAGAYHNLPASSDHFTSDGWLRTGDIGTIDEEGYLRITDRMKDLIKSGGEWISSIDLENALMGHPAVAEAAVIAIPDPKWQERPLAVVVVKPGHSVTPEELLGHLAPHFPKWYLPDHVVFVEEIPRTSTGKFMKSALRERFRGMGRP